jgi:hypothetical protein
MAATSAAIKTQVAPDGMPTLLLHDESPIAELRVASWQYPSGTIRWLDNCACTGAVGAKMQMAAVTATRNLRIADSLL